jgi:hypothetical protein
VYGSLSVLPDAIFPVSIRERAFARPRTKHAGEQADITDGAFCLGEADSGGFFRERKGAARG